MTVLLGPQPIDGVNGLFGFAEILYQWGTQLNDFWVYVTTTSAADFLISIEGLSWATVIGTPFALAVGIYRNIYNLFNSNYLFNTSLLMWLLGGMLKVFITVTVIHWLNGLTQGIRPDD